jgi:hypothetical protein
LTTLDTRPPTYVTKVAGSNAVGHGRSDGTVGVVTAVVTAAVLTCDVDDIVCAAKELTETVVSSWLAPGSASTFTSAASTLLSGGDAVVFSTVVGSSLGLGFFVGSGLSSSSWSSCFELVWAPPVLTTCPGGACDVVDPVEVDDSSEPVVCAVAGSVVSGPDSVVDDVGEADVDDVDDDCVDDDCVDDDSVDEFVDGVSAHATGNPYPVTTATPTPRATANPPTRPM